MLIYCDSVILIYYLDSIGPFQARAATRLAALGATGDQVGMSDLTRLECRVKPMRLRDLPVLARFDAFFALSDVMMVSLNTAVFDRATEIRATHGFKTADAIHVAAAVEAGCGAFLTYDFRLSSFPGIPVEVLP